MANRCYYDRYNRLRCPRQSAWNQWVRWVVLAVVVFGALALFFFCSCITARRRRKAGRQPFYGTGWAARPTNAQPYYANQQNAQPAPPYSAAPNTHAAPHNNGGSYYGNNTGGANADYYGQQNGVELQTPQPAYGGYAPPPGPPPAKH